MIRSGNHEVDARPDPDFATVAVDHGNPVEAPLADLGRPRQDGGDEDLLGLLAGEGHGWLPVHDSRRVLDDRPVRFDLPPPEPQVLDHRGPANEEGLRCTPSDEDHLGILALLQAAAVGRFADLLGRLVLDVVV